MLKQINGHWVTESGRPVVVRDEQPPVMTVVDGEQRPVFADAPRAIPAANPFDPEPEPAWIGLAMQAKRNELLAGDTDPVEVEATLQMWAREALPVDDPRPDPVVEPLSGEAWRLQPRDPETQRFVKKDTTDGD